MSTPSLHNGGSGHLIARGSRRALHLVEDQQRLVTGSTSIEANSGTTQLDFRDYLQILLKRRWTVIGTTLIVAVTVLVSTLLATPIYRATSSLQIDRDTIRVVDVGSMTPVDSGGSDDFYLTQYELLRSRALADRVVQKLDLGRTGALQKMEPEPLVSRLFSALSRSSDSSDLAPSAPDSAGAVEELTAAQSADARRALVGAFSVGLTVEPVRGSRLVRLNYDSPDPEFSQRAANAVAEAFIASNLERRFDSSSYAKGYLEERLEELKLKLEDSERSLVKFAQQEQIVSAGETSASLSDQTLSALNGSLLKAREDRIRAESRWRQAQATRGLILSSEFGSNSMIQTLQESRGKLLAEYQDKLRLFKPDYPAMRQLKGQISEIERQIADEVENIKGAIKIEFLSAQEQERLLSEQMSAVKSEVLDLQKRSIQYNIYKREVDTNRQLYDGLLQRYKQIGVAGGVSTNNVSIVDRAERGYQFKPRMSSNLWKGLFFGLMLGIALAMLFEHLDDTMTNPDDLEKHLGISVLGVIPLLKRSTPLREWQDQKSEFAEAYRSVRTALQFSTPSGSPKSLLVTSATSSEGKSTTALTLARNFAQMGTRVLLIDADLRNPTLHRTLGIDNSRGLSSLLAGVARPDDVIKPSGDPNLMVVTSGPLPSNPAELLAGSKMISLLTVAGVKFDRIIIDGPPVLGLADAPVLASVARGTLLVVESSRTRVSTARNAIKRLFSAQAIMVGGVFTKYQSRNAGYGYGYGSDNYYGYGAPKLGRQ